MDKTTIQTGFEIENPKVLISWNLTEQELTSLLKDKVSLEKSINGLFFSAEVFAEKIKLIVYLELHEGRLKKVYLTRDGEYFHEKNFEAAGVQSFKEIQLILESCFGKPKLLGYLSVPLNYKNVRHFKWNAGKVRIEHNYCDSVRGFEEQLQFTIK